MFFETRDYFIIKEFLNYGIKAYFTKKSLGNMAEYTGENGFENKKNFLKTIKEEKKHIVHALQKHTNKVKYLKENENLELLSNLSDIDAFVTKRKDVAIFTYYADCLPIYIVDKKNKAFGIAHSGWQGTYSEIIVNLINSMKEIFDSKNEDLLIALGIGISLEDYEVSYDFYLKFKEKFYELVNDCFIIKNSKYYFDNTKLNYLLALKNGILKENIIMDNRGVRKADTFSYRLEKSVSRSAAVILFGDENE